MPSSSHLSLAIFDHEPVLAAGAQIWKGGATDLTTRTIIANPPRWLSIVDRALDDPPGPPERPPLRHWAAEQINPGALPSPENAGGVILVSMNVDPAREDEFNDWYNMEHIPHFNRLPGVIAARRFRATMGNPPLRRSVSRREHRYLRDPGLDGGERDALDPAHAAVPTRPYLLHVPPTHRLIPEETPCRSPRL
jgi:hypothetical protein